MYLELIFFMYNSDKIHAKFKKWVLKIKPYDLIGLGCFYISDLNLFYLIKTCIKVLLEKFCAYFRSANSLASSEINKIWIPFVVFENTENSEGTV